MAVKNIRLFAYLDIDNPVVAWEAAIGRIQSSLNSRDGFGISLWQFSLLSKFAKQGKSAWFINEIKLENVRKQRFPESVSRLQGVYFFDDEKDAINSIEEWGYENPQNISEVFFSASNITRVDSEWITHFMNSTSNETWMDSYWKGTPYGHNAYTEILAEGIGVIQNNELRKRAYMKILELWPTSTPLLSMACCAFPKIETIAHITPALIGNNDKIIGSYYVDLNDLEHQEEIINSWNECNKLGQMPPAIVPDDGKSFFSTPDLTGSEFEIAFKDAEELLKMISN